MLVRMESQPAVRRAMAFGWEPEVKDMEGYKVTRIVEGRYLSAIVREDQTLNGVSLLLEYVLGARLLAAAGTPGVTLFDSLDAARAFLPSVTGETAILWGQASPFPDEELKERRKLLGALYQTELTTEGLMKVKMQPDVRPANVFTAPGTVLAASFLPLAVVPPEVSAYNFAAYIKEVLLRLEEV